MPENHKMHKLGRRRGKKEGPTLWFFYTLISGQSSEVLL
jgi:hypothetical protein